MNSLPPSALSALSLRDFLDAVASDEPAPGGGAVSGMVVAMAAALTAMTARYAARVDSGQETRDLVRRADMLVTKAVSLAEQDIQVYRCYVDATRLPRQPDPRPRREAMRAALSAAADVPFELTLLASEIASTGKRLAAGGSPYLRSDACTVALLASAVASSAELLVAENLRGHSDDIRVTQASRNAADAETAAEAAVTSLDQSRRTRTS